MSLELVEDLGIMYSNGTNGYKARFGIYKCFCGKEFKANTYSITKGNTSSCGCYAIEKIKDANTKHGLKKHRLYNVWSGIIKRCNNKSNKSYKNYGARGITVCDRWLDVANFIEDIYPTYQEGLSIDRINNDEGYSPDNCRWATRVTQARNTRILMCTNKTGYRGVSWNKVRKKYISQIGINKKYIVLGVFNDAISGAIAYNNYVIENNLEHTLNIIEGV